MYPGVVVNILLSNFLGLLSKKRGCVECDVFELALNSEFGIRRDENHVLRFDVKNLGTGEYAAGTLRHIHDEAAFMFNNKRLGVTWVPAIDNHSTDVVSFRWCWVLKDDFSAQVDFF